MRQKCRTLKEIKSKLYVVRFKHVKDYKSSQIMVVQDCDLSTVEAEAGGGWKFQDSLGHIARPCRKGKMKRKKNAYDIVTMAQALP